LKDNKFVKRFPGRSTSAFVSVKYRKRVGEKQNKIKGKHDVVIPMRMRVNRLFLVAYVAVLLAVSGPAESELSPDSEVLTIVYDSFARFIFTENGKAEGLYVDIITEALERRLDVPVEFIWQPWQRAQFSVERGDADAMITLVTPLRSRYSEAGEVPVAISPVGLFTAAGHPDLERMKQIRSLQDLAGYRILTYLGDGWAQQYLAGLSVDFDGKDFEAVFRKLEWGRGDVFLQIEDVTRHYISALGYEDVIVQVPGVVLGNVKFSLMISKQSPFVELLPRIDSTLREMWEDGTIKQIEEKYGYE